MDVDTGDAGQEPEEKQKAKPAKPALNLGAAIPMAATVFAIAALGASGFLFLKVSQLGEELKGKQDAELPRGLEDGDHEGGAHPGKSEPQDVIYELGAFTANTADGSHAKLDISLAIESYYTLDEWDAYQNQLAQYEVDRKFYLDYQAGKVDVHGEPLEGNHARGRSGLILAQHGAPAKTVEPPEMPAMPERPLTQMELELDDRYVVVRDLIIEQINLHSASELTSAEGRESFKTAVIEALNALIDDKYGEIKDLFFKELVTT
ncbi:flagellar basal body-associated FliL family protein [bacterium]|nr:flagellar basal body-associated FliL family protein [bacterium]